MTIQDLIRSRKALAVLSFSTGATIAAAGTAFILNKRLETKYNLIAEKEIREARGYYAVLNKEGKFADPVSALEHFVGEEGLGYDQVSDVDEEPAEEMLILDDGTEVPVQVVKDGKLFDKAQEPVNRNIFQDAKSANSHFDYDVEIPKRTDSAPFIISYDEFQQGELDYLQNSLTFFEEDDTLVDDSSIIIEDAEKTVGEQNLTRFGHGSKDPNILYIRNPVLEVDFEVVRNKSSYVKGVLGFDEDSSSGGHLSHSHRPRRFRNEDD